MWMGYCVPDEYSAEGKKSIRMYAKPPVVNIGKMDPLSLQLWQDDKRTNQNFHIFKVREHDFVILSKEKLKLKDNDIK